MRCSTCGFPLSPSRATCPRCGTAYGTGARNAQPEQEMYPTEPGPFNGNSGSGTPNSYYAPGMPEMPGGSPGGEMSPRQWGAPPGAASPWDAQGAQPQPSFPEGAGAAIEQLPFPGANVAGNYAQSNYPGGTEPGVGVLSPGRQAPFSATTPGRIMVSQSASSYGRNPQNAGPQRGNRRTTRLGLTIASVCITTGALILIFVSIMAQSLPGHSLLGQSNNQQQANAQSATTPSPIAAPTPTPSPTAPAFPGQIYIDNGRMASGVVEATGQVTQYATEFPLAQKVYVTFTVHTGATPGAVCLSWYVNNTYDNHYEFDVKANVSYSAFSYAIFHQAGPAYVEIAWASSTACTDKQLAQRVPFTITG